MKQRLETLSQKVGASIESQQTGVLVQGRDGTVRQSNGRPFDPGPGFLVVAEPCATVEEWERQNEPGPASEAN